MLSDPKPYFDEIEDPRRETKNKLHALSDILYDRLLRCIERYRRLGRDGELCQRERRMASKIFKNLPINNIPYPRYLSECDDGCSQMMECQKAAFEYFV